MITIPSGIVVRRVVLASIFTLSGIALAHAGSPNEANEGVRGEIVFVQLQPNSTLTFGDDAAATLTAREIEEIQQRYGPFDMTGTFIIARQETVTCKAGLPWRAVFVLTRKLDEGEELSLRLPAESSVVYMQGRPTEPTERGWLLGSPEDDRPPRTDWELGHRVVLSTGGIGNNETRFKALEGEHELVRGVVCRWP